VIRFLTLCSELSKDANDVASALGDIGSGDRLWIPTGGAGAFDFQLAKLSGAWITEPDSSPV
jgi:hypothetical protein